jgi:alpha-glucosidase
MLSVAGSNTFAARKPKKYVVTSPDKELRVEITVGSSIGYTLYRYGKEVISPSRIALELGDGTILGNAEKRARLTKSTVRDTIKTLYYRQGSVIEYYNQIDLKFPKGFGLQFRAYDSGIAYRFYTTLKGDRNIISETAEFNFPSDYKCWMAFSNGKADNQFKTSFENTYTTVGPVSGMDGSKIAFTPTLFDIGNGVKLTITESDIESYPGMFLKADGQGVKGVFAPVPAKTEVTPKRGEEIVAEYSSIIAKVKGARTYPWRIMSIAASDKDILADNLVYLLGGDCKLVNTVWIKPGKVAWDWWNGWALTGVPFKAGINNETYKYFIDFAAANGIEYVILDEGWSPPKGQDIMTSIPEIDLENLVRYADSKNVGLIIWTVAYVLDKKLDEACKYYGGMGIKGMKVDFIDRDDQKAVDMVERIAAKAAEYHLIIDFHGMFKPAGLNRRYPNVLNCEGVFGEEQVKWEKDFVHPEYDVTFPYIRMMSGPVDYTQGAMRNATKENYRPIYLKPSSQGTRSHQVAAYIVFDSPLVMLCDSPSEYIKNRETTDFITSIPVVWDGSRVLDGKVGKNIVMLRCKGDSYYVGALGNLDEQDLSVNLSFLQRDKKYTATIYEDGINADKNAEDYSIRNINVTHDSGLQIHLMPGGGYSAIIKPAVEVTAK